MARAAKYILILMVCLMAAGCSKGNTQVKRKAQPPAKTHTSRFLFHRVRPGETLAKIAKMYTGKKSNWRELAKCNPNIEPQHLRRGEIVKIPSRLAIQHAHPHRRSTSFGTTHLQTTPNEIFGPK